MAEMECQSSKMSVTKETSTTRKESGKRGRKPGRKTSAEKLDIKAKLERSRQSARECRARKKLRYQYLEELVADREKAVVALRAELERVVNSME
ncbi:REPTOR-binding partner-like isoform X2 [Drosophila bipectinata]|uniref:REPTOR-binding partner-like isoform X2 n=1 Tax=Drosophila bipectinata TaxID=42026 RepID=UPI001C8ADE83|nr:REPTOR-binding partner-like isoform X2 [Drosophila bipectinata]